MPYPILLSGRNCRLSTLLLYAVCFLSDIPFGIPLISSNWKISPVLAPIALFPCRTPIRQAGGVHRHFYLLNNRVFLKNTLYNQRKNLLFIALPAGTFFATMCHMPGHGKRCRNAVIALFSGVGFNGSEWRENGDTGSVWGI